MEEEIDLHLKSLSDDVGTLPVSMDPRCCPDRRTRHVSSFPLQLDSGQIIQRDRRSYKDRRAREIDMTAIEEQSIQELDQLEGQLGIG